MQPEPQAPAFETYADAKERMAADSVGKSKEQIMAELPGQHKFDLDNIPPQTHIWVKRGINPTILVCEGAQHPTHRHTLKR